MQNFASGGAGAPQFGHRRSSFDPQDMQNFASAGLALPQLSQIVSIAPIECTQAPVPADRDLGHTLHE